jgi:DNA ligase-associated metallophosphoesterase
MILKLHGQQFDLLPERIVYWKEKKALICSDFHWGREAFLQRHGMAVPEQSFQSESTLLKTTAIAQGASELWILGDFIHHPQGLHAELLAQIYAWLHGLFVDTSIKMVKLVPGNHDRKIKEWAKDLPLTVCAEGIREGEFLFLHEPPAVQDENTYSFFGHLHPAARVPRLLGKDKLPCYFVRAHETYLPAFSRLAGGAEVRRESPHDRIFVIADDRVIEI